MALLVYFKQRSTWAPYNPRKGKAEFHKGKAELHKGKAELHKGKAEFYNIVRINTSPFRRSLMN
jgi:hypothetical protein